MPVLPPFLFSLCLVFRSCVLGAIVVASLDFWPNLGLSRLEKATRLFGLMFGRFIFEFGIPGSAGSDHGNRYPPCPISGGTTAHLARYYRWSGTAAVEARYYRWCLWYYCSPGSSTTASQHSSQKQGDEITTEDAPLQKIHFRDDTCLS